MLGTITAGFSTFVVLLTRWTRTSNFRCAVLGMKAACTQRAVLLVALAPMLLSVPARAQVSYVPVSLTPYVNFRVQSGCCQSPLIPAGPQVFAGVPFAIPTGTGNNSWVSFLNQPSGVFSTVVLTMEMDICAPAAVHTLINTGWGSPGGPYLALEFFGSDGAFYHKDLFGNADIRDIANNTYTNTINGTTTINVFSSGQSAGAARLDKQRIALPASFAGQRLVRVRLIDTGANSIQRAVLYGLTVEQPCLALCSGPANMTACPAGTAVFSVAAAGTGPLSYRWQWQQTVAPGIWNNLSEGPNVDSGGVVRFSATGAAAPSVSVTRDSGPQGALTAISALRCIVTNACGTVTSNAATLNVISACNPADIVGIGGNAGPGGTPCPDGLLTGDDFNAFIAAFANGEPLADIVGIGGQPPPDGLITGDDFNAFIAAFASGCP